MPLLSLSTAAPDKTDETCSSAPDFLKAGLPAFSCVMKSQWLFLRYPVVRKILPSRIFPRFTYCFMKSFVENAKKFANTFFFQWKSFVLSLSPSKWDQSDLSWVQEAGNATLSR